MSDVTEPPPSLVEPEPPQQPGNVAAPAPPVKWASAANLRRLAGGLEGPRVKWGPATALQLVAGGIAGFVLPFSFIVLGQLDSLGGLDPFGWVVWTAACLVSSVVTLFGAGLPLLGAWLSWFLVARRRRSFGREVMAVVLGAIGGALILSAPAFLFQAISGTPWTDYALILLVFGGPPALAFALWVTAAWLGARKAAPVAS